MTSYLKHLDPQAVLENRRQVYVKPTKGKPGLIQYNVGKHHSQCGVLAELSSTKLGGEFAFLLNAWHNKQIRTANLLKKEPKKEVESS